MKKNNFIFPAFAVLLLLAFKHVNTNKPYVLLYRQHILDIRHHLVNLQQLTPTVGADLDKIKLFQKELQTARIAVKQADFWLRYLEPNHYKLLNGPLPVEYETEVHEKFEKPYRRVGGGLTLLQLACEEKYDSTAMLSLLDLASQGLSAFESDSVMDRLKNENHFLLCNRLFLLHLATIYTTGFESPDTSLILPELIEMTQAVKLIYQAWSEEHPNYLDPAYLERFTAMQTFLNACVNYSQFNHFQFIREYVNPLFAYNQNMIRQKNIKSSSLVDYSLSRSATSIFSKTLYSAQNTKGIFGHVTDKEVLMEISETGRILFNDPILSGDNQRSCSSCHSANNSFTDTSVITHWQFGKSKRLTRNTPSLLNGSFNHLLMLDGKHYSLVAQAKGVITSPIEMNGHEEEIVAKVMSCTTYKKRLAKWCQLTPAYPQPSIEHIASALIIYYTSFDRNEAPFDLMMNQQLEPDPLVVKGFNLFMGKAQCGTCHFAPIFNGVKPPYTGSEFEVLGVPADTAYTKGDEDRGRALVFDAPETRYAFRTGTLRNVALTGPYMHNGVFKTLEEVIEFYNQGGGAGRGLSFPNQTLSADKLNLSKDEKTALIAFLRSLTESIKADELPIILPASKKKTLHNRQIHGVY